MELGPQLGLAKSSSLESLHNVMHHTIKMDVVDDGSDIRNRCVYVWVCVRVGVCVCGCGCDYLNFI